MGRSIVWGVIKGCQKKDSPCYICVLNMLLYLYRHACVKNIDMKKFFIPFIVFLCFIVIVVLFFLWRGKIQKEQIPSQEEKVLISARSEAPGFNLALQNENDLQKFLADIGFINNEDWDLNQKDTFYKSKINALEIVYSGEPQRKWQIVDMENAKQDGSFSVRSSVGEIFNDMKLSIVIQADVSLFGSIDGVNSAVNDLFIKALSDVLFTKRQMDEDNILNSYQPEKQFLRLTEKHF